MKRTPNKHRSTKTAPVQRLKSAMAARRRSQAELAELDKLLAEKSARQIELETTGDIDNASVMAEIGKLQVFADMLPRRIAFKENEEAKAEENLVRAANEFIQEHLGPRVRSLAARTRTIVEKELSTHIREGSALILAVAKSERVRGIERLAWPATLKPERGAMAHAEGVLKAWATAEEVEKMLPASICFTRE